MNCDSNQKKGGEQVLLARNDADTAYEIVGGIETFSYGGDTQTEGVTSSSTIGDVMENQATGFKEFGVELSGKSDKRTGVEPVTGLNIVGSQRLADIWHETNSCNKFKILDTDTGGTIEGFFILGSFNREMPKTALATWTATFVHESGFTRVGDI